MKERYLKELTDPIDEGGDIPITFPTLMLLIVSGVYILQATRLFDDWGERTLIGKAGAAFMAVLWIAVLPAAILLFVVASLLALIELTPRVLSSAYEDHAFVAQKRANQKSRG